MTEKLIRWHLPGGRKLAMLISIYRYQMKPKGGRMDQIKLEEQLILNEGERLKPYICTAGKMTIGVGRNIQDKGISRVESRFLLKNDIAECYHDLAVAVFPDQFEKFPEQIQMVLMDMRFQLGHTGFRNFKNMIGAFKKQDYEQAVKEMKSSKWYGQVPKRAQRLINLVQTS